jgi:methionyl-tRNA formyltransferase
MKNNLRIVFMGTPTFSVGIMQAIMESEHEIVGVVTVADKPAGRGQMMHESAVKQFATLHAIPVLQPLKLKEPDFLATLESWKADVFVVVAFRMLPVEVWKMPLKGTFNLHASLLPDYRGAAPINWSIINGDKETGVTTFFIDEAIDTGNVIGQTKMNIAPNETAGELHDRMIAIGGKLVVDTLNQIHNNTVTPIPQNQFHISKQRPAPKLFKDNTCIDWSKTANEIHQFVCGLSPYPNAWTSWKNKKGEEKQVKLFKTTVIPQLPEGTQGKQMHSDKNFIYVVCDEKVLVIHEFQVAGKKRLSSKEWLVGNSIHDWEIATLESN